MGISCVPRVISQQSAAKGCPLTDMHHASLPNSAAVSPLSFGAYRCVNNSATHFTVLHVRLVPLLAIALRRIPMQASQFPMKGIKT